MDNNEENSAPETASESTSDVVMNMESMIKSLISTLDKQKAELEEVSGLLKDVFENDETYKEHEKLAKEAARVKTNTKNQILKQPQAAELNNKIRTLKSEIKENNVALSDYLREFQRMSGISEIEGEDGELREIVYTAKLVRKSSKYGN